jgi:hypothetical protein
MWLLLEQRKLQIFWQISLDQITGIQPIIIGVQNQED